MDGPKKLQPHFIGPFPIKIILNPVSLQLQLPDDYLIHPVFHVSLIKPYHPSTIKDNPPPPIIVNDHIEYEVKHILDAKRMHGKLFYLIDWKGYDASESSWDPASNVNAPRLVQRFYALHLNKPRPVQRPLEGRTVMGIKTSTHACPS